MSRGTYKDMRDVSQSLV